MKCLLVAVNAKYIHSNPAIMSLKAYYDKYSSAQAEVITCEYTINQQMDFIVSDIYEKQPNVVCFSCYIWNVEEIKYIADTLKKVMPKLKIWAGGPEVSYRAEVLLTETRKQIEKYERLSAQEKERLSKEPEQ